MDEVLLEANEKKIPVGRITKSYEIGRMKSHKQVVPVYDMRIHDWLAEKAKQRVKHKWDCPILIVGRRRTGKSLNAACIARKVDPDFPLENVAFRLEDFRNILNNLAPADPAKGFYPVAVYDESGVDLYSKDWQRRSVKEMVKIFEIIGMKRITMIFNLPHRNLLVGDLRESMQYWIAVKTIDEERGFAELREAAENENIWQFKSFWKPLCGYHFEEVADKWWTEYERTKHDFIQDYTQRDPDADLSRSSKVTGQRDALLRWICAQPKPPTQDELSDMIDLNRTTISHILNPAKAAKA